jgi:hypothetical protein
MLYQIIELFEIYSKEKTITRFDILSIKTLPKVEIGAYMLSKNIIRRMTTKYKLKSKEQLYQIMFNLLNERSYEKLDQYFEYKSLTKSCKLLMIDRIIDCPEPEFKILNDGNGQVFSENLFFGNLNESYKNFLIQNGIERNLVKVSFEFSLLYEKFLNFLNEKTSAFLMKSNTESNLIYYSYSTQKLVKKTHICDERIDNNIIYSDFYLINCINDC